MKFLLIVIGLIFFVLILVGDREYKKAKLLEKKKKYKEACYEYAVAALNGSFVSRECKKRIKFIWEKFGPFDYSDVLEEAKKDDTPEHCGEAGHAATMSIIEEITTAKRN